MKDTTIRPDVPGLIEIAKAAAREAGSYLMQKPGSARVEGQKSPFDDLLDADLEAERLILTKLHEATPHAGILSEEAGHQGTHDHYWIVDPLDGSANFQHGSPLFAISIAFVINQITISGVIYLPAWEEMFVAIQGQGAFLNDKRIEVSTTTRLSEAIVHIGDLAKGNNTETVINRLEEVATVATCVRRIRMIGTAATDLAFLACGRADILINHATHPWDVEAGKLLLLEAGGEATIKHHSTDTTPSIYSNRLIHQAAKNLLLRKPL